MTETDLQVGGGYTYQWECAILLAVNYFFDPVRYNPHLFDLVHGFLGQVAEMQLEGDKRGRSVDLEDIKTEDLPEPMREMTLEQQRAYVQDRLRQREQIQEQIHQLDEQRRVHVARVLEEQAESSQSDTLNAAMTKAAREQASERGFAFE